MCNVMESKSDVLVTNTRVRQGCCLYPLLFAIYTDSLSSRYDNVYVFKYADDTAFVGLCNDNYPQCIDNSVITPLKLKKQLTGVTGISCLLLVLRLTK